MDGSSSATTATPPEPSLPVVFPSDPAPQEAFIDSIALLTSSEQNPITEFNGVGENSNDGAQENGTKRRPFVARGRSRFRGWYGTRLGASGRGRVHHYPFPVNLKAIHDDAGDAQHENSTIVESYGHQLFAPEQSFLPSQASLSQHTWCDVCRVDCNSLKILEMHRTGKRHKRTLQLMEKMEGWPQPEMVGELATDDNLMKPEQLSEYVAASIVGIQADTKCDTGSANPKKKRRRNASPERSRVCILCNATCNSQAMFESHLTGKKHTSRIQHYQRPNTVYGLMSGYIPSDQSSSSSAPASQDSPPLYYGLMNCEQPQLEETYEFKEQLTVLDSEGQYGFIES